MLPNRPRPASAAPGLSLPASVDPAIAQALNALAAQNEELARRVTTLETPQALDTRTYPTEVLTGVDDSQPGRLRFLGSTDHINERGEIYRGIERPVKTVELSTGAASGSSTSPTTVTSGVQVHDHTNGQSGGLAGFLAGEAGY